MVELIKNIAILIKALVVGAVNSATKKSESPEIITDSFKVADTFREVMEDKNLSSPLSDHCVVYAWDCKIVDSMWIADPLSCRLTLLTSGAIYTTATESLYYGETQPLKIGFTSDFSDYDSYIAFKEKILQWMEEVTFVWLCIELNKYPILVNENTSSDYLILTEHTPLKVKASFAWKN